MKRFNTLLAVYVVIVVFTFLVAVSNFVNKDYGMAGFASISCIAWLSTVITIIKDIKDDERHK